MVDGNQWSWATHAENEAVDGGAIFGEYFGHRTGLEHAPDGTEKRKHVGWRASSIAAREGAAAESMEMSSRPGSTMAIQKSVGTTSRTEMEVMEVMELMK